MVDIPRNSAPSAYRQEMTLVDQGGEKLMIKNYFDQPLDEDMIALALDEILRRARLDVGSRAPVADVPEPVQPAADALTRAGFAGDITKTGALELAQRDADDLGRAEAALKERSAAAYGIAIENAAIAEVATRKAESLVAEADQSQDETARNEKMMQAARERHLARLANQRATAAYQTGQELETERMSTALKAQQATKLHTDLTALLAGPDNDATVVKLVELKERINAKNAPDGNLSSAERLRRAATERDREATALMQRANTARADENELADRVNRKKAEEAAAKGGKRETLAKERARLEDQLTALREENEAAFAKARVAERSTNTARGMAELAKKLAAEEAPPTVAELTNEEIAGLGQRIAGIDGRAEALALDARFDAAIAEEVRTMEQRTFDWGAPISLSGPTAARTATASRDDAAQAQRMDGGTITMSPAELEAQRLRQGGAVEIPDIPTGAELATTTTRADTTASGAPPTEIASGADVLSDGRPDPTGSQQPQPDNTAIEQGAGAASNPASTAKSDAVNAADLASAQGIGTTSDSTKSEQEGRVEEEAPVVPEMDPAERAFVLSNELAELKQVRAAEKNRARKDSLDQRIAAVEEELRNGQPEMAGSTVDDRPAPSEPSTTELIPASDGGATEAASQGDVPSAQSTERIAAAEEPTRSALEFPADITEAELVGRLFADYTSDKERITTSTIEARDRSTGLHGLELMLVDSIEAENARQLALLEKNPEQAATILGRSDRLRILKDEHLRAAERALVEGQQEYVAGESRLAEDAAIAGSADQAERVDASPFTASATPHNDAYIQLNTEPEAIYSSPIDLRSDGALSELRELNKNGNRLADLEDRIDSLEMVIEAMPPGKARDKQRDRTDKLIDDHMILRTEIGQSMGYYTNAEFKHAKDSAEVLRTAVGRLGLAPDEPLMQMVNATEREADGDIREAKRLRERADRSEDIVLRDSLYRQAYTMELEALRAMDRSLTLQNHLLSDG
ncbi:MAG: hypothetical protein JNM91_06260, partial [Flavobacteriales bacterium]|nr:hypothetical protein [Flavobacteriales bacterium]